MIGNVVLTPPDQMILAAINKKVNERIDNLWITMLGGFLGIMAFIGGIVFWDRRTFSTCAVGFDLVISITYLPPASLKTQRSQRFFFQGKSSISALFASLR